MSVDIISGSGTSLLSIDSFSNAARVTQYDSAGVEVTPSVPVRLAVSNVTVVNNDLIASFDASAFKFISMQLTGTWSGSVQFQGSNDNGTFVPIVVQKLGVVLDPYALTEIVNGVIKIPVMYKFLRVRVTAYTSGTVEGFAFGFKESNDTGQISATGTINVAAGQTINVGNFPAATSIPTGTNTIGTVKVIGANTSGVQYQKFISAVGVNSTLVKANPANLNILHIVNGAATLRYFKLYNKASAPTVGVDVPLITITLPTGSSNFTLPALVGIDFSIGLSFAVTLGVSDADTTPFTVAGEVTAMIAYI